MPRIQQVRSHAFADCPAIDRRSGYSAISHDLATVDCPACLARHARNVDGRGVLVLSRVVLVLAVAVATLAVVVEVLR